MYLVIARCTVDYQGRLEAHLPEAIRLIMIKADGSIAIHADGGAYKPLNWMSAPNTLIKGPDQWIVKNARGESLTITLHEVISENRYTMGFDPGLRKDGVEAHLQELLSADPSQIAEGLTLIRREHPTEIGLVDLLCRDAEGKVVAIEVKRRADIDGVEQLFRYLEFLNRDPVLQPVRGILVAQQIRPQARSLANHRGIDSVVVDYSELRGLAPNIPRLF